MTHNISPFYYIYASIIHDGTFVPLNIQNVQFFVSTKVLLLQYMSTALFFRRQAFIDLNSLTCIKRSPLVQRKSGLLRQVTALAGLTVLILPVDINLFPMFHYIVLNIIYNVYVGARFVDSIICVLLVNFLSNSIAVLFAIK